MSQPQQPNPDPRKHAAEKQQGAASRETKRPSDSVPLTTGPFATLPARFGRYQVEKLLGRGAMGAVYLARDTQLDRRVALKIPKVAASGSKRLLQRLETEARAAAKLDHPSLCKVFDAGEVDGQCFIAMQFIEGETLKSQLETAGKSVAAAVSLILQLASGLSEAHQLGIIHRDLKPENVMINRRGTPVIMDFGLAKFSTMTGSAAATQAGTILGSPAYMSPEQASGNLQEIDKRSDIYSLGVILFELLTGQWPFNGSAMQILGQKSLLDPPSPLSLNADLPPQLAAICVKMLAKTNAERYQTLAAVIADLKGLDPKLTSQVGGAPRGKSGEAQCALPDLAETVLPDERTTSIARRQKSTSTKRIHDSIDAEMTVLQQRLAWWKDRPAATKWLAGGGVVACLIVLCCLLFYPARPGVMPITTDSEPGPNPVVTVPGSLDQQTAATGLNPEPTPSGPFPFPVHPKFAALDGQVKWTALDVTSFKADGGATHEKLPDGSIRVVGNNPDQDTYTVTTRGPLNKVTAIKLDVLTDGAIGPGRQASVNNNNFVLNGFQIKFGDAASAVIGSAIADYSQWPFMGETLAHRPTDSTSGAGVPSPAGWAVDAYLPGHRVST